MILSAGATRRILIGIAVGAVLALTVSASTRLAPAIQSAELPLWWGLLALALTVSVLHGFATARQLRLLSQRRSEDTAKQLPCGCTIKPLTRRLVDINRHCETHGYRTYL